MLLHPRNTQRITLMLIMLRVGCVSISCAARQGSQAIRSLACASRVGARLATVAHPAKPCLQGYQPDQQQRLAPSSAWFPLQRHQQARTVATRATIGEVAPEAGYKLCCETKEYIYLDVRTKEEFAIAHPPGAINVPFMLMSPLGMTPNKHFVQQVKDKIQNADAHIVVGCRSGARSARAIQVLQQEYATLMNLTGGFEAWANFGLPSEK